MEETAKWSKEGRDKSSSSVSSSLFFHFMFSGIFKKILLQSLFMTLLVLFGGHYADLYLKVISWCRYFNQVWKLQPKWHFSLLNENPSAFRPKFNMADSFTLQRQPACRVQKLEKKTLLHLIHFFANMYLEQWYQVYNWWIYRCINLLICNIQTTRKILRITPLTASFEP